MKFKNIPSHKILHEILDYRPETGIFVWKKRQDVGAWWNGKFSGKIAGCINKKGIIIYINSSPYFAHRLAWVYMYGDSLDGEKIIDHKNCDPHQNRINNLRVSSHGQNCSNSRKWTKKSLPKGVSIQPCGAGYRARIGMDGRVKNLGTFTTPEEAHAAYCKAAIRYKGEFARAA